MTPMHPEYFVPGRKYQLEGRGIYTYQTQTSMYPPGPPFVRELYLVFEAPTEEAFPKDVLTRYVPAVYPIWAMEVK